MESAGLYSDFGELATLRHAARHDARGNLATVAEQFESLFVQMALKAMREATIEGDLFNSEQGRTFRDMADRQLALDLSRSGGLGLARMIVEQFQTVAGDGDA